MTKKNEDMAPVKYAPRYLTGLTELQKLYNAGEEIPILRYKGYTVTLEYDDYMVYDQSNIAIGTVGNILKACEVIYEYGEDLDELTDKDLITIEGMALGVMELIREIRGF